MQQYKIEKGVPRVKAGARLKRPMEYPLKDMDVGDSFFIEMDITDTKKRTKICAHIINWCRKDEKTRLWKFETRNIEEGLRVWRIN